MTGADENEQLTGVGGETVPEPRTAPDAVAGMPSNIGLPPLRVSRTRRPSSRPAGRREWTDLANDRRVRPRTRR